MGRPVGPLVAFDGSLLITDDGADKVWRVSYGKECVVANGDRH